MIVKAAGKEAGCGWSGEGKTSARKKGAHWIGARLMGPQ